MDFYAKNIYDGNLTKAVDLGEHSTSHLVRWWAEREYKIKDHEAIFIDVPNGVAEVEGVNKSMHNIIRGQSSSIRVHGRHPLTMVKLHLRDWPISVVSSSQSTKRRKPVEASRANRRQRSATRRARRRTNSKGSTSLTPDLKRTVP